MNNVIIVIILVSALVAAIGYICKSKKNGVKCIGCPNAVNCPKANKK